MSEGDSDAISAVDTDCQGIEAQVAKLRFQLALSGPYDRSAVILAVHASEGGTESQDWAEMVLRMYTRWAEKRGCTAEVLDVTVGDEAGIKNATLQITGDYAYGYARSERGGHRLVRRQARLLARLFPERRGWRWLKSRPCRCAMMHRPWEPFDPARA